MALYSSNNVVLVLGLVAMDVLAYSIVAISGVECVTSCLPPPQQTQKVNVSKDLYVVPGNDICADCGNAKPKWARQATPTARKCLPVSSLFTAVPPPQCQPGGLDLH